MNQTTQDVIEFLTHPDLDFGDNPLDVELLGQPQLLQQKVRQLLSTPASFLGSWEAEALRSRLDECDWPAVAEEFRMRLKMTSQFFDRDVRQHPNHCV